MLSRKQTRWDYNGCRFCRQRRKSVVGKSLNRRFVMRIGFRSVGSIPALLVLLCGSVWAQFRTVTVENATTNPVPVKQQGSVSVAGTVGISGTPTVSVTNTPSVNVANSPTVSVGNTPNVTVTNASSAPVQVRDVDTSQDKSFAEFVTISTGQSLADDSSITLPACPNGQQFLARTFYAGPDLNSTDNANVVNIGPWGVMLFTGQNTGFGGFTVALTVYGNGAGSGVLSLPAGMPVGANPVIGARLLGGDTAAINITFGYILSGRCGTPTVE
jgi:hypothetical protein